jgi:tetratricopeptide (TPR) repeat protein
LFNRLKKIFYFFLVFSFLPLSVSHTEESISEADIAEVVALYNEGKFTESIQKADRLLGPNGSNPTLLETKALSLQGSGQYDKALQILSILRKGKSAEQLQGYDFLTGQILMEAGKQNDAAPYFEKAVRDNYNITAAHYFLGIIDLQRNKPKEATPHFRAALESKDVSLKAPTLYYLGAFAAQKNQPEVASQYWKKALPAAECLFDI